MSYTLKTLTADTSNYGDSRSDIKYIVIHYTGNKTDLAVNNAKYFHNNKNLGASAHYFVDATTVYQSVPDDHIAYSVGKNYGSNNLFSTVKNKNSINIEMCSTSGKISDETFENTVALTKALMKKYNISSSNVYRHYDVCSKQCPGWTGWIGSNQSIWNKFKTEISSDTTTVKTTVYATVITKASGLNMRKSASSTATILQSVPKGKRVIVIKKGSSWTKCKYDGITGYCSTKYLQF